MTLAFTPGSGQKWKDNEEIVITSRTGLMETVDGGLKNSEEKAQIIC